jgi:hypothetical protein
MALYTIKACSGMAKEVGAMRCGTYGGRLVSTIDGYNVIYLWQGLQRLVIVYSKRPSQPQIGKIEFPRFDLLRQDGRSNWGWCFASLELASLYLGGVST